MRGIIEVGSYGDPSAVGYTEWIQTRAGVYFIRDDTGEIVGPYNDGSKFGEYTPPKEFEVVK